MSNGSARYSRWYYGIACLIWLVGGLACGSLILFSVRDASRSLKQVTLPGEHKLSLDKSGNYTAFHEFITNISEDQFSTEVDPLVVEDPTTGIKYREGPLTDLQCSLKSPNINEEIALSSLEPQGPNPMYFYFLGSRAGLGVLKFRIDKPGWYQFSCHYPGGRIRHHVVFSIGHEYAKKIAVSILLSIAIIGVTGIGGIIAMVLVWKARKS